MVDVYMRIDSGKRVTIDKGDGSEYVIANGTGSMELVVSYSPSVGLRQVQMAGSLNSVRGIDLSGQDVKGPIGDYANLSSLDEIDVSFTSTTGDIGGLSGVSTLRFVTVSGSSINGDFGQLSVISGLLAFYAADTSVEYYTKALPVWNDIELDFENCGWVESMVDALLADLDVSGSIDGELYLYGNDSPSAAGLISVANLELKGWFVGHE